jgi:hypothetical protein
MAKRLSRDYIYRPIPELDAELLSRARECIKKSKALLEFPVPSSFLGASFISSPGATEHETGPDDIPSQQHS